MPQVLRALTVDPDETGDLDDTERLLRFNRDVLGQALSLVDAYASRAAPAFAAHAGPHLRHVIEHYEALLLRPQRAVVDYDNRPRDRELERCTLRARARLQQLRARLAGLSALGLDEPISVVARCGVAGECELRTRSSVGRELMFLASHAVHHFAVLRLACAPHGVALCATFGKAPATLHHELKS
jgi:hypothetical protein